MFARRCVYVRNRPQPSATVRNRSREGDMVVPMVSSAEGVTFGGFTCGIASFRVAGMALRDMQTFFVTCRKSFRVAAVIITFATFSEDALQFSWQAQHFVRVHRHLAGQARHFERVELCVFRKSHWRGPTKW